MKQCCKNVVQIHDYQLVILKKQCPVHLLLLQSTPSSTLAGSTTDVSGQSSSTLSVSTLTSATSVTTASSNTGIFTLLLLIGFETDKTMTQRAQQHCLQQHQQQQHQQQKQQQRQHWHQQQQQRQHWQQQQHLQQQQQKGDKFFYQKDTGFKREGWTEC